MLKHGTTSRTSMADLLSADDAKPATVFCINASGPIREGITLSLSHPLTGGKPALMLGEHFTLVSNHGNGCLFRKMTDTTALVRRLDIRHLERPGKSALPVLVNPTSTDTLYLQVDTHLPVHIIPKERFCSGVMPNDSISIYGGTEYLVRLVGDGDSVDILYGDGSVRQVVRTGNTLKLRPLMAEDQARVRIQHALYGLATAAKTSDESAIKGRDWFYHQLAAIIAVGGRRSATTLTNALDPLTDAARDGDIRSNVKQHVIAALHHAPAQALQFGMDCDAGHSCRMAGGAFGRPQTSRPGDSVQPAKGKPEQARKRAERSASDRNLRESMRGARGAQNSGTKQKTSKKH